VKGVEIFSVAIECLAMLSFVVVYAMAFVAILNARQGGLHFIVLLVAIIGYFVVLTSVQGESRYRHPIMPFISILAGYGLTLFKQKLQERFLRMKGNR
jgi:hypothetical protein